MSLVGWLHPFLGLTDISVSGSVEKLGGRDRSLEPYPAHQGPLALGRLLDQMQTDPMVKEQTCRCGAARVELATVPE